MAVNTNPETRLRIRFVKRRHMERFTKHMMSDPITKECIEEVFDDSILFDLKCPEKRKGFMMGLLDINKHIKIKKTKAGFEYLQVNKM